MPMIYAKPLTRQEPEGEATLIEKLADGPVLEMWKVHFNGDAFADTYYRAVRKEDV